MTHDGDMIKHYKLNTRAQVFAEYAFVIVIIVAVISAMAVYVRRALQARIWDARNSMIQAIANNYNGVANYTILNEYEPYYSQAETEAVNDSGERASLLGGGSTTTGVFLRNSNSTIGAQTNSEQLPPRDAK